MFNGITASISFHPRNDAEARQSIALAAAFTGRPEPYEVHAGHTERDRSLSWSNTWAPDYDRHEGPNVTVFFNRDECPETWAVYELTVEGDAAAP